MKAWNLRDAHIDAVIEMARARLSSADMSAMESFIRRLLRTGDPEDILARPVDVLFGIALSVWKFIAKRPPGQSKIRVFNPTVDSDGWHTSHTVIQLANDDMPFLVDSITGNLSAAGITVHMVIHPILDVVRDGSGQRQKLGAGGGRESVMHIEIDRKSSAQELADLEKRLSNVLADVRLAVNDWPAMCEALTTAANNLANAPAAANKAEIEETRAFLEWLRDNNFTLLGYREYDHTAKSAAVVQGLGLLRDPSRQVLRRGQEYIAVSDEIRDFLAGPHPLLVVKANEKSTVHRPVHMDLVSVKRYDPTGKVAGEYRFVGLFTSTAYNRRAQSIPYLRRKIATALEKSGFDPNSHDGKGLLHILDTFPRDELFQIDDTWLFETAMGILYLQERPHARVFLRQDKYERYVSALVFIPRELYESTLRNRIETILCNAYNGEISARYAQLSDDVIARWHFIVRTTPGQTPHVNPDDINRRIAQVARGWRDQLKEALIDRLGQERAAALMDRYAGAFPPAYRDTFSGEFAVIDIEKLESITGGDEVRYNFYRLPEDREDVARLKIYHPSRVIPLSECMPLLENLGLKVIEEFAFDIKPKDAAATACIHNFYLVDPLGHDIALSATKDRLEDTLMAVHTGLAENDGFNALVLKAGLTWRQVSILRAYARYLRQVGMAFSEDYIRTTLADFPHISRGLVDLFDASFNPAVPDKTRKEVSDKISAGLSAELEKVASLDQDRILRSFRNTILATLRTNYYQQDENGGPKPALAFKINTQALKDAPLPKPFAEIFVYSPRVEGVHLRLGPVARGGLRWSDRPEDFRTEVLGLVKAQQVKNAVIVPVGAKGGFYPKCLPKDGNRDAVMAEGIACYKTFISALLDVTDNLVDNEVVPPEAVVRHDGDDPYFVVAADKGTATFSDYANAIAQSRHFWLDDAFASGGSHGYDHKKMGITARGAWVSVERHFRELGINIKTAEITAVGVGDMSGDVFGNGMLRSDKLKLIAAFDHRHIFIDPDPDPAKSYAERQRLFNLPRSSWADYNTALLSKGGQIIDRKAKSVVLSPEARAVLDIAEEELTPSDIIQAVLKARVDLLWFGGIGTYVKAHDEANRDVGDRVNDGLRVNARDLRCKVVGEGANLGVTQRGRIEFAQKGGAINTDSVDNSGGVNCSDREVNIKILLNLALRSGKLTRDARDKLLADMTADVAALVLEDNYLQTLSLTLGQAASGRNLEGFVRLIHTLERTAGLNRALETLPLDEELAERRKSQMGLTRPELAVVVSYAKMALFDSLQKSSVLDDPYLEDDLLGYFPPKLAAKFGPLSRRHRLRREIIGTVLANQLVNRLGPDFAFSVAEEVEAPLDQVVRAYVIIRDVFELPGLWREIDALDNVVSASIQTLMYMEVVEFTRRLVLWLLRRDGSGKSMSAVVKRLAPGIQALRSAPTNVLSGYGREVVESNIAMYQEHGVPAELAARVAGLDAHWTSGDVVEVAHALDRDPVQVVSLFFTLGSRIGYDWLRTSAEALTLEDHWEQLATAAIADDLLDQQRALAQRVLAKSQKGEEEQALAKWEATHADTLHRVQLFMTELKATQLTLAKLGYASRHLRTLLLK